MALVCAIYHKISTGQTMETWDQMRLTVPLKVLRYACEIEYGDKPLVSATQETRDLTAPRLCPCVADPYRMRRFGYVLEE